MFETIKSLLRVAVSDWKPYRHLKNRARFPGLYLSPAAHCAIAGRVEYGSGCSIGHGANLIIPEGSTLRLGDDVYIGRYVELGPAGCVEIGDATSIQDRSLLVGDVSIGRYCSLSLNVLISSGRHYYELRPEWLIRDQDATALADPELASRHSRPVRVEDDCWLGVNSVILPGVTVSRGCVVGANSVITRDLPPYSVAVGAPARIVKKRLDFRPPRRLEASRDGDLPYFYEGCAVAQRELADGRAKGGVLAAARFRLAMDIDGCRKLTLIARCSSRGKAQIALGDQVREVGQERSELSYDLPQSQPQLLAFAVHGDKLPRWPVCVEQAWAE